VILAQRVEAQGVVVEPGQELQGDADAPAQVAVGGSGVAPDGGSLTCPPEEEPVQEGAGQGGVRGRFADQFVFQPAWEPFEVLMAFGKYAGVHEDLPDVSLIAAGWQLVEKFMADRLVLGGELCQEQGVRAGVDPADRAERRIDLADRFDHGLQLRRDRSVGAGQQRVEPVAEDAERAASVPVGVPGTAALTAGEVDVMPDAGPADPGAVLVSSDQRLGDPAARAFGRGADDGGVAGLADRPHRPVGHHRTIAPAAGTGHKRPFVTGVTGRADRLAGAHPLAGTGPAASGADRLRAPIAAVAQIRLIADRVAGDPLELSAAPTWPTRSTVPVVAQVAERPFLGDQRGGRGRAARHALVLGPLPASDTERPAIRPPHRRGTEATALAARLHDRGILAVAAVADPALGPSGDDRRLGGGASGARPFPRTRIAAPADPPLGSQLAQVVADRAAAGASRPHDRVSSVV
jgi:hypothetical protein